MAQLISSRVVGLGWPSRQKSHSSSPLIGNAPQLNATDCTPGVEATAASAARNDARIAAGLVCNADGESEKPKVKTLRGWKPGIHIPELNESAKGKSGANQQNQSEAHLHNHQDSMNALARAAAAAAAFLQTVLQVGARNLESRHETEKNSCKQGGRSGEKQHAQVNVDFSGARQSVR